MWGSARLPFVAVLLAGLAFNACAGAGGGEEAEPPSQAVQEVAATREAAASTPPPVAEDPDDSVIVLEEGAAAESSGPVTLAEAARRARQRRTETGPPVAVITNETLEEYDGGKITYLTQDPSSDEPPTEAVGADLAVQEEYWRSSMMDARLRWREAVEEIDRLTDEVAGLQREFYATDDPAQRDQVIQPAWDLALAELEEARLKSEAARHEVQNLLERGRQEGAQPGWLREGIELEPESTSPPGGLPTVEPGEPQVVEEREEP